MLRYWSHDIQSPRLFIFIKNPANTCEIKNHHNMSFYNCTTALHVHSHSVHIDWILDWCCIKILQLIE